MPFPTSAMRFSLTMCGCVLWAVTPKRTFTFRACLEMVRGSVANGLRDTVMCGFWKPLILGLLLHQIFGLAAASSPYIAVARQHIPSKG